MDSRSLRLLVLGLLAAPVLSCGRGQPPPAPPDRSVPSIALTSPAFAYGAAVPARFTCDGAGASPPLRWARPPKGTRSLLLTCDDPDAPGGDWTHWILYDVPPAVTALPEGVPPAGARQCRNSFGNPGYGGPCPPRGSRHRYVFRLYALDASLRLPDGATAAEAQAAARGHVLGAGTLTGTYQRP